MGVKGLLAGAVLIGAFIAVVVYAYWGNTPELTAEVLRVRTLQTADDATVAVMDARFRNPSRIEFEVRQVRIAYRDASGEIVEGTTIAHEHNVRLFEQFPVLGDRYNDTLTAKTKVAPGETVDRMLVARFEKPLDHFEQRQAILIEVEETEGAVSKIEQVATGR